MKPFKLFITLTSILAFFIFFKSNIWAYDLEINCWESACNTSSSDPLFYETNIYPTWSNTKILKVTNNYSQERIFAIELISAEFSDSVPPISPTINITIKEGGIILYGPKTLLEWKDDGYILLSGSPIPANQSKDFEFNTSMQDVGNDYQGKTLTFDMLLGFDSFPTNGTGGEDEEEEEEEPASEDEGIVAGLATALGGIFEGPAVIPQGIGGTFPEVLGQDIKEEGAVKGEETECSNPRWWPLLLILQIILSAGAMKLSKNLKLLVIVPHLLLTALFVYIFATNFCLQWLPYLSLAIGGFDGLLILRKTLKNPA